MLFTFSSHFSATCCYPFYEILKGEDPADLPLQQDFEWLNVATHRSRWTSERDDHLTIGEYPAGSSEGLVHPSFGRRCETEQTPVLRSSVIHDVGP